MPAGRRRSVISVSTPSAPSEPTSSSRIDGPAAVLGTVAVDSSPAGAAARSETTLAAIRPRPEDAWPGERVATGDEARWYPGVAYWLTNRTADALAEWAKIKSGRWAWKAAAELSRDGPFVRGFAVYEPAIMLVGAIPVALLALFSEGLLGGIQRLLSAPAA